MNRNTTLHAPHCFLVAMAWLVLALGSIPTPARAGDWKFTATPYIWATDLGVKAEMNGRQVIDDKVSVGDLVEMLDMIVQGRFDAQYRTIGLATDVFDVTMSDHVEGANLPNGAGTADFSPDIRMTILDVAASYSPPMRQRSVTALGGMRMVYERADVDATYHLASGPTLSQSYETHETLVDGLVGVRFAQPFSRHWGVQGQVDVSTGGTRYTWSAAPSVVYVFDAARRYALSTGYRHMQISFKESDGFESDMTLSGALLGFRVTF